MSASFSYDRYDRRSSSRSNRGLFSYWLPVATVVTIAAGGLAAWVWSARSDYDHTDDEDADLSYGEDRTERREFTASGSAPPGSYPGGQRGETYRSEEITTTGTTTTYDQQQQGIGGYVQGAARSISGMVRRTPSPQQLYDTASKRVVAGVAAAGAMMGGALSAIREEGAQDYEDHEAWSQETATANQKNITATSVESQQAVETHTNTFNRSVRDGPSNGRQYGKRRTVAVVVSAESPLENLPEDESKGGYATEQATILQHLPPVDFSRTNLLILIYAPHYQQAASGAPSNRAPSSAAGESLGSSYATVAGPGADEPAQAAPLQAVEPTPHTPALSAHDRDASAELYDALYSQALARVERPADVLAFSSPAGFVHMLKHIQPQLAYVVETLAGADGANIAALAATTTQIVVVVGGEGGQLGGLIDTEDEGYGEKESVKKTEKWWEHSDMIGLGKGVEIVDGGRLTEDFDRRVAGRE